MSLDVEPGNASVETLLPVVMRIVGFVRRRQRLSADEGEDFSAYVQLKLVERGSAILGGFRGRSRLETYLSVVVERMFLDYRASRWGKWRPSPVARRLGPEAIRLEELMYRDHLSPEDAVRALARERPAGISADDLRAICAKLPPRRGRPRVEEEIPIDPPAPPAADPVTLEEDRADAARIEAALARALASLPPQDRVIVRLHFFEGLTVASISGVLGLPQKPLYRRIEAILQSLRRCLREEGIDARTIESLTGRAEFGVGMGNAGFGPSRERVEEAL